MLGARRRNIGFLTMMHCVVTPHHALQFWKFTDHVADQIGFGDIRGTFGIIDIRTQLLGQIRGNGLHTRHAFALRAELVVINHSLQFRHHVIQTAFFVLLKKELRIRQTRAHHARIAFNNLLRRIG